MWINDWSEEQEKYHKTLKTKKHGRTVIVSIIQRVQKIVQELWFSRNDALHQNNKSRAIKEKNEDLDMSIDEIFKRRRLIPLNLLAPADRRYFRRDKQALIRMRITRKERWVQDAEHILNKYDLENETEQIRRFRSYFMHRDDG